MTERDKMLAGKLYDPSDKELYTRRVLAHNLCTKYNVTLESNEKKRAKILKQLLPNAKQGTFLQGPVYFDYGDNTYLGENFFANFHFTVLDCCPVHVGDNVFVGPNVSILTPVHPFRYQQRNIRMHEDGTAFDYEYAKPITIGNNCWLAGNVTVCGGVTIGDGCVIGAGSVVTRDIPPNSLAVGNPCRVLRQITENDDLDELKNL
ncbi:MAG: sugar O-acetyltransferase [Clostridiales bacterium]|nr:sugar O-acetyltransferase [Clostridiales bacterium]